MKGEGPRIVFRRLAEKDLPRLFGWFQHSHVRQWYAGTAAKYGPRTADDSPVKAYIFSVDGEDAGYIQMYALASFPAYEAAVGDKHLAGIDLFIGDARFLHLGIGPLAIRRFVDEMVFANTGAAGCVAGPSPLNRISIRAFHKAGFRSWKQIQTDDGNTEQMVRIDRETSRGFRCVLFDWGGTLMSEDGPLDFPMADWPEVSAIDGAAETLAALSRTHRIGIATNAVVSRRADIERALERVELLQYITDIFCFTEIGARKDSLDFWSHVLSRLRMKASEVAMIGDTLEQDVLGPRKHGVHTIWFNDGGRNLANIGRVPVVTRLPDVIPLLA